jgi:hypothetical protein
MISLYNVLHPFQFGAVNFDKFDQHFSSDLMGWSSAYFLPLSRLIMSHSEGNVLG